ncbi:MAG TPA: hypothetical protein VIN72_00210 [Lutibacter sp.]
MEKILKSSVPILLLLSIFLISFNTTEKQKKNDLQKMNLKGKVKKLTYTRYTISWKLGEETKRETDCSNVIFNKEGNKVEENQYLVPDCKVLESKLEYKYNSDNDLIGEYSYDFKGNLTYLKTYKYDYMGNLEQEVNFNPKFVDHTVTYNYKSDENGNQVEWRGIGFFEPLTKMNYDSNNNMVYSLKYDRDMLMTESNEYTYDSNGNNIDHVHRMLQLKAWKKFSFKYDNLRNVIEITEYENNSYDKISNIEKHKYKYDSKENWIEEEVKYYYTERKFSFFYKRDIEYYSEL